MRYFYALSGKGGFIMRTYDFKKHECKRCEALMTYEFFNKYHTERDCNDMLIQRMARVIPIKEDKNAV